MTDTDEPRWDRLPHDPVGFFGLGPGFDRIDLRRGYNRWIRRFRPDRSPKEFQRIRAAFERLERWLEAGGGAPVRALPAWRSPEVGSVPARSAPGIDERLPDDSPERAFELLLQRSAREPRDYLRLAILSDVVRHPKAGSFAGWLVEGLQRWPGAAELEGVLAAYCRRPEAIDEARSLLLRLAALGAEPIARLGEPLWLGLLRRLPFPEFAALVARCAGPGRPPLSLAVFRAALFRADDVWVEEVWERIAPPSHGGWHGPLEEHQLTELMVEYRRGRAAFVDGDPIRTAIDAALEAVAAGPRDEELAVLRALSATLADRPERVLDAFPRGGADHFAAFTVLCAAYARNAPRLGRRAPGTTPVLARVREMIGRLDDESDRTLPGVLDKLSLMGLVVALPVGLFFAGVKLLVRFDLPWVRALGVGAWCAALIGIWWYGVRPLGERIRQRQQGILYERIWRRRVLEFVRLHRLGFDELLDRLEHARGHRPVLEDGLIERVRSDYGIAFASLGS